MSVQVKSSHVATVDWNEETKILTVEYKDGARYEWIGIGGETAARIVFAPSVGKAMHSLVAIKGRRL